MVTGDRIYKLRKEIGYWKTQYEGALDRGAELQEVGENCPFIKNYKEWDDTMTMAAESRIDPS